MNETLGRLERVDLRRVWQREDTDFTPWLALPENLTLLASALNLDELEAVETEHSIGDFNLDILCTDAEGTVVIENQIEETDHRHLGQIITYAAGAGARKIIWIARSFRQEHLAALQFLNDNTTDNLNFFAVEIELWRIADSPCAPKFQIVARPNDWTKSKRNQAQASVSASPTKKMQLEFWIKLIAYLSNNAPHIKPQKPGMRHWLQIAAGRSGFLINPTVNTQAQRLGVELYINNQDAKFYFDELLKMRSEIESALKFELDWQQLPEKTAVRIASWYAGAPLEDEERWPEYRQWITDRLVSMDNVLRPIIRDLPEPSQL